MEVLAYIEVTFINVKAAVERVREQMTSVKTGKKDKSKKLKKVSNTDDKNNPINRQSESKAALMDISTNAIIRQVERNNNATPEHPHLPLLKASPVTTFTFRRRRLLLSSTKSPSDTKGDSKGDTISSSSTTGSTLNTSTSANYSATPPNLIPRSQRGCGGLPAITGATNPSYALPKDPLLLSWCNLGESSLYSVLLRLVLHVSFFLFFFPLWLYFICLFVLQSCDPVFCTYSHT